MKKATWILLCTAALMILLVIAEIPFRHKTVQQPQSSASSIISNFNSIAPSSQGSNEIITTASVNENIVYTVKEYKGHIGIFRNRETEPFQEIQVAVDMFPETDRELLKRGIKAYGSEELNKIIEDYEG